jgi:hypothetical protein
MRFVYHAHDHESEEIGVTSPKLDLHGRALVYPRTVPPDHPEAARKIKSGLPFDIDDRLEPVLAGFLRADRRFQKLRD